MLQPLQANEVHLWMLNLLANAQHSVDLWDLLSEEEQGRARCCHIERDRRRFVVRRGMLRQILAQYLGMEPASISLGLGPYGKPEVAGAGEGHILCFSTSHADDLGVVAVTRDHEIGVDVVAHQPRNESFERVASLFAAEEQSWLASMTSESWLRAFFDLWACKEAFVKALGLGLACPLDQFAITFAPPHAPRLLYAPASAGRRPWGLQRFNVGPGFSAALAAEDCLTILRQFECIGDRAVVIEPSPQPGFSGQISIPAKPQQEPSHHSGSQRGCGPIQPRRLTGPTLARVKPPR